MYTRYCNTPVREGRDRARTSAGCKDFADGQTMLDPTFNGKNILEQGNSNWPELDVPGDQQGDGRGRARCRPSSAPRPGPTIDKQVTEQAAAIPWIWDKQPLDRVRQRQRRRQRVQRPVGPRLDVAEVSGARCSD